MLHLIDHDLEAIAQAFDPMTMDDDERELVILQGLPGAREMFEAGTSAEREAAKMRYLRASLLHEPELDDDSTPDTSITTATAAQA